MDLLEDAQKELLEDFQNELQKGWDERQDGSKMELLENVLKDFQEDSLKVNTGKILKAILENSYGICWINSQTNLRSTYQKYARNDTLKYHTLVPSRKIPEKIFRGISEKNIERIPEQNLERMPKNSKKNFSEVKNQLRYTSKNTNK